MATVQIDIGGVTRTSTTLVDLVQSAPGAWEAHLREDVRHDESPAYLTNNNLVEITIDGVKRFHGWLRANEPQGIAREGVAYTAYDIKWRLLNEVYARINGSVQHIYNEEGAHDPEAPGYGFDNYWTVGEVLIDILEHALGVPGGGSDIPEHHDGNGTDVTSTYLTSAWIASYEGSTLLSLTQPLDEFELNATRFGEALDRLLEWQSDCFWYIDPATRALVVRKLSASTAVSVNAGEVNHFVDESGKSYDLVDDAIQLDLSESYTKIVLQGRDQTTEVRPAGLDTLSSKWPSGALDDALLEPAWDPDAETGWNQADADAGLYIGTPKEWVYRLFRARSQTNRKWRWGFFNEYGAPLAYTGRTFYHDGANLHRCTTGTTGSYAIYCNSGQICFLKYLPAAYRSYSLYFWGRVERPWTVEAGPSGSAYTNYGLQSVLALYNEGWETESSSWPHYANYDYGLTVRDDTSKLTNLANKLIGYYGKERMAVEVVVGGIDFSRYNLTKKLNFANLTGSKWGGVNLQIFHIVVDPEQDTMRLSAANRIDGVMVNGQHIFRLWDMQRERRQKERIQQRTLDTLRRRTAVTATLPPA
ncbi:MAG: hypothetical protein GXP25_16180 [Planctomycetes bacterium]|nr:hypothetical protein [Planctomycetota bacterium]